MSSSNDDPQSAAAQRHKQVLEEAKPGAKVYTTIETHVEPADSSSSTSTGGTQQAQQHSQGVPPSMTESAHNAAQKMSHMKDQVSAKASELGDNMVAPKSEPNEAEKSVDNMARGMLGAVVTAPLAAAEAIAPSVTRQAGDLASKAQQTIGSMMSSAKETTSSTASTMSQKAGQAVETTKQTAADSTHRASDMTRSGRDQVSNTASSMSQQVSEAGNSTVGSARSSQHSGTTTGTSIGDMASNLVGSVSSIAQSVLPTALGGRPAEQQHGSIGTHKPLTQSAQETVEAGREKASGMVGAAQDTASSSAEAVKEHAGRAYDTASSTVGQATSTAGDLKNRAYDTAASTAQHAKDYAGQAYDSTASTAKQASSTAGQYVPSTSTLTGQSSAGNQEHSTSAGGKHRSESTSVREAPHLPSHSGIAAHNAEVPSPYARKEDNQPHTQIYTATVQTTTPVQSQGLPPGAGVPRGAKDLTYDPMNPASSLGGKSGRI